MAEVWSPPSTSEMPNSFNPFSNRFVTTPKLPPTIGTMLVDTLCNFRICWAKGEYFVIFSLLLSCYIPVRRHSKIYNQPPVTLTINNHNIRMIMFHFFVVSTDLSHQISNLLSSFFLTFSGISSNHFNAHFTSYFLHNSQ